MEILYAVLLGITQGLTEFLPVSSSGHLVLLQNIFGIEQPGLFFDTMLHTGTLAAVLIVLKDDIWHILKKIYQPITFFIIIGTVPAVIIALAFGELIEHAFDTGKFLGFCFLITSGLLVLAEKLSKRSDEGAKTDKTMSWIDAGLIGLMQAFALAPGISRSGATISAALFRKLDRNYAAHFSFLLSIPAILGALVLQVKDIFKTTVPEESVESIGTIAVIAGTLTAAITGIFAVKFMLRIIKHKSLYGFAVYTGALGVLVLFDQFITKIIF